MYARGMTMRDMQGFLAEQYGVEVSPEFISSVTDAVMAEVGAWQSRPTQAWAKHEVTSGRHRNVSGTLQKPQGAALPRRFSATRPCVSPSSLDQLEHRLLQADCGIEGRYCRS